MTTHQTCASLKVRIEGKAQAGGCLVFLSVTRLYDEVDDDSQVYLKSRYLIGRKCRYG